MTCHFVKNPLPDSRLITMSTYSNQHNLPAGYIEGLKSQYPDNLISAYLEGKFTNLLSSTVYQFNRKQHTVRHELITKLKSVSTDRQSCNLHVTETLPAKSTKQCTESPNMMHVLTRHTCKHNIRAKSLLFLQNRETYHEHIGMLLSTDIYMCVGALPPCISIYKHM